MYDLYVSLRNLNYKVLQPKQEDANERYISKGVHLWKEETDTRSDSRISEISAKEMHIMSTKPDT